MGYYTADYSPYYGYNPYMPYWYSSYYPTGWYNAVSNRGVTRSLCDGWDDATKGRPCSQAAPGARGARISPKGARTPAGTCGLAACAWNPSPPTHPPTHPTIHVHTHTISLMSPPQWFPGKWALFGVAAALNPFNNFCERPRRRATAGPRAARGRWPGARARGREPGPLHPKRCRPRRPALVLVTLPSHAAPRHPLSTTQGAPVGGSTGPIPSTPSGTLTPCTPSARPTGTAAGAGAARRSAPASASAWGWA